jgi:uncharacterized protein with HEPN domain
MKREIRDYISDILESIKDVSDFTLNMDFKDFTNDRKTINAVIRSLEIIGEAAKKIPDDLKNKYPDKPWKQMAGMRDKLIHEYHGVDLEIVWKVIKDELPPLEKQIHEIWGELEKEEI